MWSQFKVESQCLFSGVPILYQSVSNHDHNNALVGNFSKYCILCQSAFRRTSMSKSENIRQKQSEAVTTETRQKPEQHPAASVDQRPVDFPGLLGYRIPGDCPRREEETWPDCCACTSLHLQVCSVTWMGV